MRCQHEVTLALHPTTTDTCGARASFYTDDLKELHWLCADHEAEVRMFNDFEAEELP